MKLKAHVPNTITLLNLTAGFVAILINDPVISPLMILLASFFDLFDGLAARLLDVRSALGEQLDSLADLISFGVAPAFIYFHHLMNKDITDMAILVWVPVASAIRLAVYNTKPGQELHFRGLPAPSAGLFLAFFVYAMHDDPGSPDREWIFRGIPLIMAALMVSNIGMLSLKNWRIKSALEWVLLGILALGIIVFFSLYQFQGIWLMVLLYILVSFIFTLSGKAGVSPS